MTEEAKERYLKFLREKYRRIDECFRAHFSTGNLHVSHMNEFLDKLLQQPAATLTLVMMKSIDGEHEDVARQTIGQERLDVIVASLKRDYGFGRIAADSRRIIVQVLRAKRIKTNEQLRVVLDYLTFIGNGTKEEREELDRLASRYQRL
jgi:hypothetical protein